MHLWYEESERANQTTSSLFVDQYEVFLIANNHPRDDPDDDDGITRSFVGMFSLAC